MDGGRTSSRIAELAKRHHLSPAFLYKEIAAGHLRARKAGTATIITDEDEKAWLDAMPIIGEPS
ncbi:MAG: DNA-binding protein [Xanthobacteraceae bacterium]